MVAALALPQNTAPVSAYSHDGELDELCGVQARSPAMRQTLSLLARLAPTDITITLLGETGTGKDRLAHAIHCASKRCQGSFTVLDCGAVAPNLAESELMGHERGAFTGAIAQHTGAFERAHGGTLFIDEVGELPLELQTRLLRVLECRSVRRVGGRQDRAVNVRVIAATNRDLVLDVSAGRFRQDLYYRLTAAVVRVPALRERRADMCLLVGQLMKDLRRPEVKVSAAALEWMSSRSWRGNVRELKNALAYALVFVDGRVLDVDHFASLPASDDDQTNSLDCLPLAGLRLASIEQAAIQQTLTHSGGDKAKAAHSLGIAVSTLHEKLKHYGVT